jgi:peptidoglycan/xylan/chitin deacetylase (PgdA/CDA1 family)
MGLWNGIGNGIGRKKSGINWSSYWKTLFLNEYLLDEESGNIIDSISSNDGTAAGSLSSEIAVVNKGRVFNGVDTSISLTATHTFLTTDNITISFWFKPASISSVTYQILDRTTNIGSIVACYMRNTTISFRVRGSNSAGLTTIDYPLAITVPNVWYHIICERNVSADTINLWINGIPKQAATTDATTANIGPLTLKIGAAQNESTRFAGTLDELRIGKTLLSPADKLNLYNYNRNGKGSRFNKGYLVITFDDSVETQYTNGFPLLQAQGVRATFFTQTNVIGMVGRNTWANLTEMYNAGMDLQCHTHSATSLTLLDEAGVIAELQAVNAAFIANSLPVPLHIGYPQGEVNDTIEGWIRSSGLRLSGRQTGPFVPIYPYTNEMRMMSYPVDSINAAGITAVKAILDNCVYYKNGLIIYAHCVDLGTVNSVSSASLNEIIDYAQSIGVEIVTMSQLHTLMD